MPLPVEVILQDSSCMTCTFLQEKVLNFFLHFVGSCKNLAGILQESCMHIPARFLQDPTKFKKNYGPFLARMYKSCQIVLQDHFYWVVESFSLRDKAGSRLMLALYFSHSAFIHMLQNAASVQNTAM